MLFIFPLASLAILGLYGVMFFKVPSGLCIYFITSSLWGICERKLLPKPPVAAAGASRAKSPVSSGGDRKSQAGSKARDKRRSKKKR